MTASIYQRVLGARFHDLDPVLQRYFGAVPADSVGVGDGVYAVAGPAHAWLVPLFAAPWWRGILFPERGRDVPFVVRNRPTDDGGLAARRTFRFRNATRTMVDEMHVDGEELVDRLGPGGRLEVRLRAVVADGGLRLTSTRLGLRVGAHRLPLPPIVRVSVVERADARVPGRQRVDVRVRMPVLGDLFRYAGAFVYRIERA